MIQIKKVFFISLKGMQWNVRYFSLEVEVCRKLVLSPL